MKRTDEKLSISGYSAKKLINLEATKIAPHAIIRYEGTQAYTDGRIITLPALNNYRSYDEKPVNIMTGYAIHESLHLKETDISLIGEGRIRTSPLETPNGPKHLPHTWKRIWNFMEDARIEKIGTATSHERRKYIDAARVFTAERTRKSLCSKAHPKPWIVLLACHCNLSNGWSSRPIDHQILSDTLAENPEYRPISEKIRQHIHTMHRTNDSYEESFRLLSTLATILTEDDPDEEENAEKDSDENDGLDGLSINNIQELLADDGENTPLKIIGKNPPHPKNPTKQGGHSEPEHEISFSISQIRKSRLLQQAIDSSPYRIPGFPSLPHAEPSDPELIKILTKLAHSRTTKKIARHQQSGDLDITNLHEIALQSDFIYQQTTKKIKHQIDMHLLIDISASTHNIIEQMTSSLHRITLSMKNYAAIRSSAHTYTNSTASNSQTKIIKTSSLFFNTIYTLEDHKPASLSNFRYWAMHQKISEGTPTHLALMHLHDKITKDPTRAHRSIVILITDGVPSDPNRTDMALRLMRKTGIISASIEIATQPLLKNRTDIAIQCPPGHSIQTSIAQALTQYSANRQ